MDAQSATVALKIKTALANADHPDPAQLPELVTQAEMFLSAIRKLIAG